MNLTPFISRENMQDIDIECHDPWGLITFSQSIVSGGNPILKVGRPDINQTFFSFHADKKNMVT